ncbi:MAG: DegT/DnrJ/EryC1/StrS family aminotransferase [bacterium]
MNKRIYLSPPQISGMELEFIKEAIESGWVAPLGPEVEAFEREMCEKVGVPYGVALSSGTAALHLALRILAERTGGGKGKGSEMVICSTFTFAASANVIAYEGYVPVFIDCDEKSWNMDPELLHEELKTGAKKGKLPAAVIVVDLYGQCADYRRILPICAEYGVPVIEDAAEALGAKYYLTVSGEERMAGSFGEAGVFSFNGNKIITTAGGGMLVSHNKGLIDKARFLATQARDPAPYYQHSEIGFNYRMSNILAAIGRAQLRVLKERISARRRNFELYRQFLGDIPGIGFMPEADYGSSTRWLTCITVNRRTEARRGELENGPSSLVLGIIRALEAENIEARPLWKPLHLQPVFNGCPVRSRGVAERLFANGLCLPSGSSLSEDDLKRVCEVIRRTI